jgi:enoyl-CoA hydratase
VSSRTKRKVLRWIGKRQLTNAAPHALIEQRGDMLIVTMNRPAARNALTGPMMALMRQAWDQADSDPGIRVCVLTGTGGAFCAGADLKAMARTHPGEQLRDR